MKIKSILTSLIIAIIGGVVAVYAYTKFVPQKEKVVKTVIERPVGFAGLSEHGNTIVDFVPAAQKSIEAVVHVKTESTRETYNPLLEFFYGDRYKQTQPVVGFGSGVIISADGYIVTNNHVVEGSDDVYVTLNDKREFKAKMIGTDPSTDLALLKIEGGVFQYIPWGDSDNLQVGEWVLAVGNPFNLTSTVTAGIVSAKGKNIGIIKDQYRMESFIQTDAAVNRGNSGGALVNTKGELVGINTAILSPSGGYAGISFAVPVVIVHKVVKDLIEFGAVQRAILGVTIQDVTAAMVKERSLDKIEGVYVSGVREDGAAKAAGIKEGDIIIKINDVAVNSSAELQEQVSRYRPNDKVRVEIKRDGKTKHFEVTLRNLQGSTEIVKIEEFDEVLGARFTELSKKDKSTLGIRNGLKVTELRAGKLRAEGVREGFVITKINNQQVNSIGELKQIVNATTGGVYIEGVYPDGVTAYYAFGLR
jgi:Do/DeqQ family serine protease